MPMTTCASSRWGHGSRRGVASSGVATQFRRIEYVKATSIAVAFEAVRPV
jgi:hypothetical protein